MAPESNLDSSLADLSIPFKSEGERGRGAAAISWQRGLAKDLFVNYPAYYLG